MDPQKANGVEHCGLDIFAWQNNDTSSEGGVAPNNDENAPGQGQGILTRIDGIGYQKIDILDPPNQKDTGKQAALALWHHLDSHGEEVYNSDSGKEHYYPGCAVFRWEKFGSDTGWAPAEDLYPGYYKKLVA